MTRKPWPLAAFATVALIGAIGAGCGSGTPSETSVASTATAGNADAVRTTDRESGSGIASDKRATDRDKAATPSPAPSLPSRIPSSSSPGRLLPAPSRQPATTGAPGSQPNSP